MKKLLLGTLIALSSMPILAAPLEATYNIHITDAICFAGVQTYVTSNHLASVMNNTDIVQKIYVSHHLCVDKVKKCKTTDFQVKVNPHQRWTDQATLNLYPTYKNAGRYTATASTKIAGPFGLSVGAIKTGFIDVR